MRKTEARSNSATESAFPKYVELALDTAAAALRRRDAVGELKVATDKQIADSERAIDLASAQLANSEIDALLSGESAALAHRAKLLGLRDELAALEARRQGLNSRSEQADTAVVAAHEVLSRVRLRFRREKIDELQPQYEGALAELFRIAKQCQAEMSGFAADGRLDGLERLTFPEIDSEYNDVYRLKRLKSEGGAVSQIPAWAADPELLKHSEQLASLRRLFRRSESENKAILERRSKQAAHAQAWPARADERKSA